ncbi:MAG: hypothetical protein DRN40_05455 [Thermoplasmata archaeon]|nr:MAG: hypothetical protein DRN40_05455 [Thermoplasmata archaeon]
MGLFSTEFHNIVTLFQFMFEVTEWSCTRNKMVYIVSLKMCFYHHLFWAWAESALRSWFLYLGLGI